MAVDSNSSGEPRSNETVDFFTSEFDDDSEKVSLSSRRARNRPSKVFCDIFLWFKHLFLRHVPFSERSAEESQTGKACMYDNNSDVRYVSNKPLSLIDQLARFSCGWRQGVLASIVAASLIFIANLILLVIARIHFDKVTGAGILYLGDCDTMQRLNTALHLVINILSTALIGASNFTMQCLSSPTRSEVDRAHSNHRTVEIGIPSLRNLLHIKWWRAVSICVLSISSLPLHFLWNSVIYPVRSSHKFGYLIIDGSFLANQPFQTPNRYDVFNENRILKIQQSYQKSRFTNMTVSECISHFTTPYPTGTRNLLAVTVPINGMTVLSPSQGFEDWIAYRNLTFHEPDSTYSYTIRQPLWTGSSLIAYDFVGTGIFERSNWVCYAYDDFLFAKNHIDNLEFPGDPDWGYASACDKHTAMNYLKKNGTWYLRPRDGLLGPSASVYPIEYCLVETNIPQNCMLQYIPEFLTVVVICNGLKLICMLLTVKMLFSGHEAIFATAGDAVDSFLGRPDEHTRGRSLMRFDEMLLFTQKRFRSVPPLVYKSTSKAKFLFKAAPLGRFLFTICVCLAYLLAAASFLYFSLHNFQDNKSSVGHILQLGLGIPDPSLTLWLNQNPQTTVLSAVLLANSFQVALTITHYVYNSYLTSQFAALEWSTYFKEFRPLRVTNPVGQQKSTWFLHLPLKYGVLMSVIMTILHWLATESVFLQRVEFYDLDGNNDPSNTVTAIGYSPVAILCAVCVGSILPLFLVFNSFRSIDISMPPNGNFSAVISAACHPDEEERRTSGGKMATKRLRWGVVGEVRPVRGDDQTIGHCAFSHVDAEEPQPGCSYA